MSIRSMMRLVGSGRARSAKIEEVYVLHFYAKPERVLRRCLWHYIKPIMIAGRTNSSEPLRSVRR